MSEYPDSISEPLKPANISQEINEANSKEDISNILVNFFESKGLKNVTVESDWKKAESEAGAGVKIESDRIRFCFEFEGKRMALSVDCPRPINNEYSVEYFLIYRNAIQSAIEGRLKALGEKKGLIAKLGHEINNSLAVILSNTDTLMDRLSDEDIDPEILIMLQENKASSERIRDAVRDSKQPLKPPTLNEAVEMVSAGRILYIDDEVALGSVLKREFKRDPDTDFTVDYAMSGNQAIEMLKESDYDFVISDVMMKDGNGMDVRNWIEKNKPELLSCFRFITGGVTDPELANLVGDENFKKPFEIESIIGTIRKSLTQKAKAIRN